SAHRGLPRSVPQCLISKRFAQSGHPSIGGHRVAFLVRTVRLGKPHAAGIELQRQSLVLPAIAERSLAGPHTQLSGARSGHPEIPTHRDASRPCLCWFAERSLSYARLLYRARLSSPPVSI